MQEIIKKQKQKNGVKIDTLSFEDKQVLVSVFGWLIQEDKKQNPSFYQFNKSSKL